MHHADFCVAFRFEVMRHSYLRFKPKIEIQSKTKKKRKHYMPTWAKSSGMTQITLVTTSGRACDCADRWGPPVIPFGACVPRHGVAARGDPHVSPYSP